jgi:hypothetical protein
MHLTIFLESTLDADAKCQQKGTADKQEIIAAEVLKNDWKG